MKSTLSHLDKKGRARMVDVAEKAVTDREARAEAYLRMLPATLEMISAGDTKKGDVFSVARIAGIQAAKRTHELIPLCHALMLSSVSVDFELIGADILRVETVARCSGQTGVEMEALTAASIAALTVYDMVKAVDRGMEIQSVRLLSKRGGKSGEWLRPATKYKKKAK